MKKILVLSLAICLSSSAFALNWQMVGARSMAMGGAGVVTASGTNAQYYNPSLLGEPVWDEQTDENGFHIGVQMETPKIGTTASGTGSGMSYIRDLLKKGYVPYANMDIGFGVRRGNFAFSIRSLDVMSFTHNGTKSLVDTGLFTEAAVGYGFYLFEGVRLGGNLKVIQGTTMEKNFDLAGNVTFGSLMKHSWNHKKLSADWAIDLGASVNLSELFSGNFIFNPDIGFTVRNLNTPKFKRPERPVGLAPNQMWNTDEYKLKPQYRLGAAIHPIADRLTIAADLDLNKNDTSIKDIDYKSRQLSAGLEAIVWNDHTLKVPLRVGFNKNLEEDEAPTYVTTGFGILGHTFDFELGLAVGDKTEKIKKHDWPNALGLSMTFAWYF